MAKPISVQLYSVREAAAQDFPGTLKRIADMGYAGVEFAGLHGHSARELAGILNDLGLIASSAHTGLANGENIEQLAEEAEILGYNTLITGFGPDDMKTEDGLKACVEKFAAACDLVKPYGLTFGIHNHWWEFDHNFGGKTSYEIIMNSVPDLISELDIYWVAKSGMDVVRVIKDWGRRIPLLHVKDGDLGEQMAHKAVGEGKVPIKDIITSADTPDLQWLVVELDECDTDMLEAVEKSYKFLVGSGLAVGRR